MTRSREPREEDPMTTELELFLANDRIRERLAEAEGARLAAQMRARAVGGGPFRGRGRAIAIVTAARPRASRDGLAIAGGVLIEALLILGFVIASLGIGREGRSVSGPDRPPSPVPVARESRAAPAPRPMPGQP
jgi:hypothetical protein